MENKEMTELSNELAYRKFLFNQERVRDLFKKLSIAEYLALHIIMEMEEKNDIYSGRTYLKDLAERMQQPIRKTSNMVGSLKEKGLLVWAHDGDGSEGTYVTITETGKKLLVDEEKNLKDYYGRIIEKFGKENLIQMLKLMKQLETVISAEIEGVEEEDMDA